ncbi:uncharacterized protein DSM5745_02256 [Aspergillus mulundensis]|uniref:Uncharacterized protein n=1 Tax=Aspergillus mulundensis TaxID=1810919 RepID=A0A3D8SWE4_9EURO|nr:Uncharacterized protein DSM5745_02256 [Aspergillus mulundensis]RDW90481.1 Uncharacterized protein DSM5745_02256 [Aspergillus mulundensis]
MASITCHRHLSPGPGGYDHYVNHNNGTPPLHLAASTLAATSSTPLYSNPDQHSYPTPTSLAVAVPVPSLDIPSDTSTSSGAVSDQPHPCHSFDLAGGVYILSESETTTPGRQNTSKPANGGMVESPSSPPPSSSPDKLRTPKRKRTVSPTASSTKSPGEIRSTSRSTRRSGGGSINGHTHSRQSSLHSHRRTNTVTSLTPSVPDSPIRRENLLALHRESCRLFQDNGLATATVTRQSSISSSPPLSPRPARTYSNLSSPPVTPILESHPSPALRPSYSSSHSKDVAIERVEVNLSTTETKPTVIEWTSPSTRRREYEKIDRASSGVRGLWRRVAPRWCQFGDKRVPFFEEGKDGKANYEGSVRRFRMDLPDEPAECRRRGTGLKIKPRLVVQIQSKSKSRSRSKTNSSWL